MLGGPGAGKGTQADAAGRASWACRTSRRATCSGPHIRDGTALGKEVQRYVEQGALVPDDVTVRMVDDRLGQPDAARRRRSSTASRAPCRRPRRSTGCWRSAARGSRGALYIEVDPEELVKRLSGRRVCTGAAQHVYHVVPSRPRSRASATSTARRSSSAPTTSPRPSAPA